MRTEFKIFLTGVLCVLGSIVYGQQIAGKGTIVGHKQLTSKRFESKHSKKLKRNIDSKSISRVVLKARKTKEAEKE